MTHNKTKPVSKAMAFTALLCALALTAGCGAAPEGPAAAAQPQAAALETPANGQESPAQEGAAASGETGPEPRALPQAYAQVLAQYGEAMAADYYRELPQETRDSAFGAQVALEWKAAPQPAYYALYDLDGNGTEELLIAAPGDVSAVIYDCFTLAEGALLRPFSLDFGGRTRLELFPGGVCKVSWSNSAFDSGMEYYRFNGGAPEILAELSIQSSAQDPNRMVYLQNGTPVAEEAFQECAAGFQGAGPLALDWAGISPG